MSKIILLLTASALAALFIALFFNLLDGTNEADLSQAMIGKKAPSFSFKDLITKENLKLDDLLDEKYTLINVWASWCISCKDEHPFLMQLKRENKMQIIGINYKDKTKDALNFLDQLGNPYHYIVQDQGKIGFDFGVYAVPETLLIDKKGVIRYKLIGTLTETIINQQILPLIEAK